MSRKNYLMDKLLEIESLTKDEFEFLLSKTLHARRQNYEYYNYLFDCNAIRNKGLDEKTFIRQLRDISARDYIVPSELVA